METVAGGKCRGSDLAECSVITGETSRERDPFD